MIFDFILINLNNYFTVDILNSQGFPNAHQPEKGQSNDFFYAKKEICESIFVRQSTYHQFWYVELFLQEGFRFATLQYLDNLFTGATLTIRVDNLGQAGLELV